MNQDLYDKQLEKKLSGITDNTERYNIVNDFMSNKEDVNKTNTRWGSNKVPYQKLDNVFPKFTPYSGPSTSAPFSYKPGNANYGIHTPDTKMDTMWNWAKGVYSSVTGNTEEKRLANTGDRLTAAFHGIPEYNSVTGQKMDIKGLSNLNESDLEYWKKLQTAETAKSVRQYGSNINPFTEIKAEWKNKNPISYEPLKEKINPPFIQKQTPPIKNPNPDGMVYRDPNYAAYSSLQGGRTEYTEPSKAHMTALNSTDVSYRSNIQEEIKEGRKVGIGRSESTIKNTNNILNTNIAGIRDTEDLAALQSRIKSEGKNGIKTFFNSNDLSAAKEAEQELLLRQNARSRGIPEHQINQGRVIAPDLLKGVEGNIPKSTASFKAEKSKSYIPEHGVNGIGLGFVNSMKASRTEHAVRAVALANPLGASSREIFMNSIGLATKQQKMNLKMSNTFMGRVGAATIPLGAIAYPVYSMSQNESAGQIAQDWAGFGGLMVGLRSGVAAGAALTPEMSFARFAMQGVGGAIGGVTGLAIGTAAVAGIRDIVSNESHIRKFAKGLSSKELIVKSQDTQQSLTSRQSALNKLAKSGLNDRRQLLGNESLALSGLM